MTAPQEDGKFIVQLLPPVLQPSEFENVRIAYASPRRLVAKLNSELIRVEHHGDDETRHKRGQSDATEVGSQKVQLIDATQWYRPLRKNLGKKNCELGDEDIKRICDAYLNFEETEQSKIFPGEAFGYWKVIVERPLRLRSQLTVPRIEALRFASGDEEIRETLYEEFGDALVEDFGSIKKQLTKRLAEWGSDDDDDDGGGGKSLPESKKKKLLKPETWQRDARLVELGTWLREQVGGDPFDDYNVFAEVATEKLAELDSKPSAAELKLVLRGVSDVDETAPPVIAKVSKPNKKGETKVDADPTHGRYRWGDLPECLHPSSGREDACPAESVVGFEPDPDLRDSEQIPLLEPGGIEAFIDREVLPYTPDAWLQDKKGSVKIGYEISFTRHFYKPEPLRTLDQIRDDIVAIEKEAEGLLDDLLQGSHA